MNLKRSKGYAKINRNDKTLQCLINDRETHKKGLGNRSDMAVKTSTATELSACRQYCDAIQSPTTAAVVL
jgi:hypothetical protein